MKGKIIVVIAAVALVIACSIGSTLAWLTDKTEQVVNTFTAGDINITLTESEDLDLKMVPGKTLTKDPVVTVKSGSEDCWLFVKIEKSSNFDSFMEYAIADGWTPLDGYDGIYYRQVEASATDQAFGVIKDNQVTVKDSVTKEDLTGSGFTQPTLTFTAYAVQKFNFGRAEAAWSATFKTSGSGSSSESGSDSGGSSGSGGHKPVIK